MEPEKAIIIITLSWVSIVSFVFGVIAVHENQGFCTYQSIGSRLNIPYYLGCEISRERFK